MTHDVNNVMILVALYTSFVTEVSYPFLYHPAQLPPVSLIHHHAGQEDPAFAGVKPTWKPLYLVPVHFWSPGVRSSSVTRSRLTKDLVTAAELGHGD